MKTQLPKIDSISELARFWDNHDITDFEDLLEEVTEPVFGRRDSIQIHLEKDEIESIEKIANQRDLKNTELIREWIIEKLKAA